MPLDDFKALLSEYDLEVVSTGTYFEDLENSLDAVVKNAKDCNAKYVMCAWVPHDGNNWGLGEIQNATKVFNGLTILDWTQS